MKKINLEDFRQKSEHSSLSRLWSQNTKYDCGAITAYRGFNDCGYKDKEPIGYFPDGTVSVDTPITQTKKDKKIANASLTHDLAKLGYSFTRVLGKYPEGGKETKEVSYFVVDIKNKGNLKKDLTNLGTKYKQDSILYAPKGSVSKDSKDKAKLIGTNKCPNAFPAFGKTHEFNKGEFGVENPEYTSYINGRPFVFSEASLQGLSFSSRSEAYEHQSLASQYQSSEHSSLSRLYKHNQEHQTGTISAFRLGNKLKRNLALNKRLKLDLLAKGYGVTNVLGKGQEEGEVVDEVSFFVVDLEDKKDLKKVLISLGTKYNQDSITFSEPKGQYILISTNTLSEGTGGGRIGVEIKLGRPNFGHEGEFYSTVRGRPFVFSLASEQRVSTSINAQQANRVWAKQTLGKIEQTFFSSIPINLSNFSELENPIEVFNSLN